MGTNDGFVVIDIKDPAKPKQVHLNKSCTTSQGDVVVYGNILVRSWDSADQRRRRRHAVLRRHARRPGLRGHPHLRHHRPDEPRHGRRRQRPSTASRACASPPRTCRARAAARTRPRPCRPRRTTRLYIYNGGSSGTCTWMDVLKIKISDPTAGLVRQAGPVRPLVPRQHGLPQRRRQPRVLRRRQRHHDVQVRRHDRPDAAGRHREPDPDVVPARWASAPATRPRSATTARRSSSAMSRAAASRRQLPGHQLGPEPSRCSS